jgi:hypothetical protein
MIYALAAVGAFAIARWALKEWRKPPFPHWFRQIR